MRDKIGVLLVEEKDGQVGVQLFNSPSMMIDSFANLNGNITDKPRRGTAISLSYKEGVVSIDDVQCKTFPKSLSVDDVPDGYLLGDGPVFLNKK